MRDEPPGCRPESGRRPGKQDLGNNGHLPFHRGWIPDSTRQHGEPHVIDPENVAYKAILEVQDHFDRSQLARSDLPKRQGSRVKCPANGCSTTLAHESFHAHVSSHSMRIRQHDE